MVGVLVPGLFQWPNNLFFILTENRKNSKEKSEKKNNKYLNKIISFICICIFFFYFILAEYIKQCHKSDPELTSCLKASLHHLKPYLAAGIPEIEVIN